MAPEDIRPPRGERVGRKYPVDIQKVVDPETGAHVTRYVHEKGEDRVFYYSGPYITADGRKLVFWSSVSGRREIHSINIADNEPFSVQLTQGCTTSTDHPCVDWERNLVFTYFDEATQRSVLPRIARHIVPGGILVIGKSEALPDGGFDLECRDEILKIFQMAPADLRI